MTPNQRFCAYLALAGTDMALVWLMANINAKVSDAAKTVTYWILWGAILWALFFLGRASGMVLFR